MPITKSAKKKLRQDKIRTKRNGLFRNILEKTLKTARKTHTKDTISKAFKIIDKAAKKNILHKNKAVRLKSSLSKLIKAAKKS